MRPRRDDAPLPAEIEAELAALDAALAGDEVPVGMEGLEALVTDLRADRPTPPAEFGEKLDAWAAAGFPRDNRRPRTKQSSGGESVRGFLDALTPRRLAYAGGAAATLVVIAVGVAQIDFGGDEGGFQSGTGEAAMEAAGGGGGAGTQELEKATPPVIDEGQPGVAGFSAADAEPGALENSSRQALDPTGPIADPTGPARGREKRKVERDAQLTLAAPADEVQDVTNEAIGVIEAHDGIVESSQTSGSDESARATLQLLIPTRDLDATLDELSDLADVKSLSEGTVDITRPYIDAKDRMDGLRAERKSLLAQIQVADTEAELDTLKVRLASVERELAQANATFRNIQRRAALSNVTLQITSEGARDGDWSLGDALDDAGRVLTVAAGIALISAAVLLPLALIAAIAYFVMSAARNRSRERALDE
jgi:hypothetical protein